MPTSRAYGNTSWERQKECTVDISNRSLNSISIFRSLSRSSPTHALLYVIHATRRGGRTSSASKRAILMVMVFVLPLPGPARTTQLRLIGLPLFSVATKLFCRLNVTGHHLS